MLNKLLNLFKKDTSSEKHSFSTKQLIDINDDKVETKKPAKESMFDYVIEKEQQVQKEKEEEAVNEPHILNEEEVLPDPEELGEAIPETEDLVEEEAIQEEEPVLIEDEADLDESSNEDNLELNDLELPEESSLDIAIDSSEDLVIKKEKDAKVITSENTIVESIETTSDDNEDDDLLIDYQTQEPEDKLDPTAKHVDRSSSIIKENSVLSALDKEITKSVAKEYERLQSREAPKVEEAIKESEKSEFIPEIEVVKEEAPITYVRSKKGSRIIRPN